MTSDDRRQLHIQKIVGILTRLAQHQPVQITSLTPLRRILSEEETPDFMRYLIGRTLAYVHHNESLSVADSPDSGEKIEWLERLLLLLDSRNSGQDKNDFKRQLKEVGYYCDSYSKGWKRIWIHATRQILDDVDLCLMEWVARCFINDWFTGYDAYVAAKYYCTSYENHRFTLTTRSETRVKDILDFLHMPRTNDAYDDC
ncbi:hypothetical protein [Thiolapillus sp.]|uniref:hypothetical protein n=2 Tax=Thiolapillus sp. TaxID=2017437 RepID=UPI003AF4F4F1